MAKRQKKNSSTGGANLFQLIGWIGGLLVSATANIPTPFGLTAPFGLGGTLAGMVGFAIMFWLVNQRSIKSANKPGIAVVALVLGLAALVAYRKLWADIATPSFSIELLEFALYCFGWLCAMACVSFAYWQGGPELLRLFRPPHPGG